jgi:hypothetical protein
MSVTLLELASSWTFLPRTCRRRYSLLRRLAGVSTNVETVDEHGHLNSKRLQITIA